MSAEPRQSVLWLMGVDTTLTTIETYKNIRRALSALHPDEGWTTNAGRELVDDVLRNGPQKCASGSYDHVSRIMAALAEDSPELVFDIDPTPEEILAAQPTQVLEPSDEELDIIAGETERQGALVAVTVMGAVEGDPVQATGLAAMLGNITGHDAFRHATVLLSEAYQLQIITEDDGGE